MHARFRYRFLHRDLLRRLTTRVGRLFGEHGEYWQTGLIFESERHRAVARLDCHRRTDESEPGRGELHLTLHGSGRQDLFIAMRHEIERCHDAGAEVQQLVSLDGNEWVDTVELEKASRAHIPIISQNGQALELDGFRDLVPGRHDWNLETQVTHPESVGLVISAHPPVGPRQKCPVYISYAWGDDTPEGQQREALANELVDSLKADNYDVRIDREQVRYRDSIEDYVNELGNGLCIVAVISAAYLRSEWCMHELRLAVDEGSSFDRLCPVVLPDAKFHKLNDRAELIDYWQKEQKSAERSLKKVVANMSATGLAQKFDRLRKIVHHTDEMLDLVARHNTQTAEILSQNDFARLKQAINECLKA